MDKQNRSSTLGVSHEERKARMREYYRKNKEKWQKYNRDAVARLSKAQQKARCKEQREYRRSYYQENRERIIARTARYQKERAKQCAAYRRKWHQENKPRIAAGRRRHYHAVVKPRKAAAKAKSEFLTVREAVTLLGAKLRAFREWVYAGRIQAVRTAGGRYLLRREYVEQLRTDALHLPKRIRERLGLVHVGGTK